MAAEDEEEEDEGAAGLYWRPLARAEEEEVDVLLELAVAVAAVVVVAVAVPAEVRPAENDGRAAAPAMPDVCRGAPEEIIHE